jgi:hypothetical protein
VTEPRQGARAPGATLRTPGEALAWVAALVFMLSSFMGWYAGSADGLDAAILGWHTGVLGKLVFVIGLAALALLGLRAAGFRLPPALPVGVVVTFLGAAGTICVLVRLLSVPDDFAGFGRSIGIWVSLAAAVFLTVAGLLQAADEV